MKIERCYGLVRLELLIACILAVSAAHAPGGDLTTDNLTVNNEGKIYGNLSVKDGAGTAPTNGLVLYFSLSTNTSPVPDDSGNSRTGTVYGGASWVTNGITGGTYNFDGTDDYIQTAANGTGF